jgi:hypothetical protein
MRERTRRGRRAGDFSLAPPCRLRNNSRVKIKIFLFLAVLGLLFTSGCISLNG